MSFKTRGDISALQQSLFSGPKGLDLKALLPGGEPPSLRGKNRDAGTTPAESTPSAGNEGESPAITVSMESRTRPKLNLPRIVTEGENPNPSPKNKMSPGLTNRMDFGKLDSLLGKGPPKSPKFGKKASSEPSDFNTTEEVVQKAVMEDDEGKEEIKVTKTVGQDDQGNILKSVCKTRVRRSVRPPSRQFRKSVLLQDAEGQEVDQGSVGHLLNIKFSMALDTLDAADVPTVTLPKNNHNEDRMNRSASEEDLQKTMDFLDSFDPEKMVEEMKEKAHKELEETTKKFAKPRDKMTIDLEEMMQKRKEKSPLESKLSLKKKVSSDLEGILGKGKSPLEGTLSQKDKMSSEVEETIDLDGLVEKQKEKSPLEEKLSLRKKVSSDLEDIMGKQKSPLEGRSSLREKVSSDLEEMMERTTDKPAGDTQETPNKEKDKTTSDLDELMQRHNEEHEKLMAAFKAKKLKMKSAKKDTEDDLHVVQKIEVEGQKSVESREEKTNEVSSKKPRARAGMQVPFADDQILTNEEKRMDEGIATSEEKTKSHKQELLEKLKSNRKGEPQIDLNRSFSGGDSKVAAGEQKESLLESMRRRREEHKRAIFGEEENDNTPKKLETISVSTKKFSEERDIEKRMDNDGIGEDRKSGLQTDTQTDSPSLSRRLRHKLAPRRGSDPKSGADIAVKSGGESSPADSPSAGPSLRRRLQDKLSSGRSSASGSNESLDRVQRVRGGSFGASEESKKDTCDDSKKSTFREQLREKLNKANEASNRSEEKKVSSGRLGLGSDFTNQSESNDITRSKSLSSSSNREKSEFSSRSMSTSSRVGDGLSTRSSRLNRDAPGDTHKPFAGRSSTYSAGSGLGDRSSGLRGSGRTSSTGASSGLSKTRSTGATSSSSYSRSTSTSRSRR